MSTIEGAQALADSYTAHFIDFSPSTAITSATLSVTPPVAGRSALGYGKFELVSTDPARAKRHISILQETRAIDAGSVWYDENKELFTGEFVLGKTYYVKPYLRIEDTAAYDWDSIQEVVVPGNNNVGKERCSYHTVQLSIAFVAVDPLPVTATAGGSAEATPVAGQQGTYEITATPDSGYEFSEWRYTDVTVADPGAASTTATVTGDNASVEAVFERKQPSPDPKPAAEVSMLRAYNPWSGEHLFTDSMAEVRALEALGWRYEGVAWVAPASSSTPVWRLYNPFSGDHHYTTDRTEYQRLGAIDWRQEGVGFYSDDAKGLAVWRLFNPFVKVGTHHYTTGRPEYDALAGAGWVAEGVGWWALR